MILLPSRLRLRFPFTVPLIDAPGVVPGVSYSGEACRGVLPMDGIVVSVGEVVDEALRVFFEAMTGMETSLRERGLGRA